MNTIRRLKQSMTIVLPVLAVGLLCALALRWQPALAAPAGGTVGSGTPASCTEAALDAAMAGGGSINFNCGPNPYTLTLTSDIVVTKSTSVDGGGKITLSGGHAVGLILDFASSGLTLTNITLTDGQSAFGGCIAAVDAALTTVNTVIRDCHSKTGGFFPGDGGALTVVNGTLSMSNTLVLNNVADVNGGGIYLNGGTHTLDHVSIVGNRADITDTDSGGGIFVENHANVTLLNSQVASNIVGNWGYGGGMAVLTSTLQLTNVSLAGNQGFGVYSLGGGLSLQGATAGLNAVTLTGNRQVGDGGAIVSRDSQLTIANSSINQNSATSSGGGLYTYLGTLKLSNSSVSGNAAETGGGLYIVDMTASLDHSTLNDNQAAGLGGFYGGGIYNSFSTLTVNRSSLSGNQAEQGGSIYNQAGTVTLTDTTLSGNSANAGGGIYNGDTLTLTNSTLSGNQAVGPNGQGGGISNVSGGTTALTNVTLSGNSAGEQGGGIYNQGRTQLLNITLSNNAAPQGGALFMANGYTTVLTNTILAYSPSGGNCNGTITASKFTFSSDNTCGLPAGNTIKGLNPNGLDPLLDALGNFGGPTTGVGLDPLLTHMLKAGSPAKDGVVGSDAPSTDERGLPRPALGGFDIGAVERQPTDVDTIPKLWLPLIVH